MTKLVKKGEKEQELLWSILDCIFSFVKTAHWKPVETDELIKHVKPNEHVNDAS